MVKNADLLIFSILLVGFFQGSNRILLGFLLGFTNNGSRSSHRSCFWLIKC